MDFDKPKVYGDTFISDGLVLFWVASLGDAGLVDHLENDKASPPEAPMVWEEPGGGDLGLALAG